MANVDYFLKITGVEGESTDDARNGEMELLSWDFGGSNSSTHESGTTGGSAGKVNLQQINIVKRIDKASPLLFQYMAQGKHITDEVVLTCRRAGENPQDYLFIRMKPVYVSSYQTSGSSGDVVPTETLSLNVGAVKFEYAPQKEDGSLDAYVPGSYNIQTNKAEYPA